MKEWIEEFEIGMKMLENTKQKQEMIGIFNHLEWMKDLTLDTFIAMDEQLEEWVDKTQRQKSRPYRSRGTAFFDLHMYEQAAEQFVNELKQCEHPLIRLYAAYSYLLAKKFEEANAYFINVIKDSTDNQLKYFALCGLAQIHVQLKQYEAAIPYYEKALHINRHPDVVYNLGMCFFHMNKPEHALPFIESMLRLTPNDYGAYYLLGRCFVLLNDYERANRAWLCALQLTTAKNDLLAIAYEFEEMGHYLTAIHCYKQMLRYGHRDENIEHGLAWNYGLLDERILSLKWFQTIFHHQVEIDPTVWLSFIWLINKWNDEKLLKQYHDEIKQFINKYPQYESLIKR